jgi:hypothetical protein
MSAGSQKYGQINHEQATRLKKKKKKKGILNGRDYFQDLYVGGRIISNRVFKK